MVFEDIYRQTGFRENLTTTKFDEIDDPLHREHLDDTYFNPNTEGNEQNYVKRLVCEYL